VEWGFVPGFHVSHNPNWRVYSRGEITEFVFKDIGESVFHAYSELSENLETEFSNLHDQVIDTLEKAEAEFSTKALGRYLKRAQEDLAPYTFGEYINAKIKSAPRMTRDSEEIAKGQAVPAHIQYLSTIRSLENNKKRLKKTADLIRNVMESIKICENKEEENKLFDKIFIGHGRSGQWRILKDFIKDRLGLEYDEFNRVSVAGIGTQERLSEMLSDCGFAFLVLTAEDIHEGETLHARENVVHEAGLFQGKLGWRKAIVLLEEGCEEFSNISGLGQIRFPKDDIGARFEEIRAVLEREKLLKN